MPILSVAKNYLVWHYSTAYVDLLRIWWNYLWFVNHLFAVPEVMKSWFSPFKRLQEEKSNILLHTEEFFANLFVNIMMRIVGTFIRTALIVIALCSFAIILSVGICFILLWTILPILVGHFLISGLSLLMSGQVLIG